MKFIQGFVERYDARHVSGWADIESLGDDSILELCIDGKLVGEVAPSICRPDLNDAPVGFFFELDIGLAPSKACRLEVRTKGSKTQLGNSPIVVLLATDDSKSEVIEGRDACLFLANGSSRVIDQIQGVYKIDGDFIEKWSEFAEVLNAFQAAGVDCRFLVVPNKECVLDDLLPPDVTIVQNRPISSLVSIFASKWDAFFDSFFYPIALLKRAPYGNTYTPGDTHWTTYGAWCGVEAMFRDTYKSEVACVSEYIEKNQKSARYENADLLSKMGGVCVELKPVEPFLGSVRQVFDNQQMNTGSMTTWTCDDPAVKKVVLIYHDSFGPTMFKYLAKLFGEVHTVWLPNISSSHIADISPDILIIERVERFLIQPSVSL